MSKGLIKLPTQGIIGYKLYELSNFVEFPYNSGCSCCVVHKSLNRTIEQFESSKDIYERVLVSYIKEIGIKYDRAIINTIKQISSKLADLNNPSLQQVNDIIVFNLLNNWQGNFISKIPPIISKNIKKIYKEFRLDGSIFKGSDHPAPSLGIRDTRTVDYMNKLDNVYLGRFVTDNDTRRRISNFIKTQYEDNSFRGSYLKPFTKDLKGLLKGEDWKIARIITTTANKIRNYASINYMHQAEIKQFERIEVNDRLTCPWCRELDGTLYDLTVEVKRIDKELAGDPNIVSENAPFATSLFKNPADLKNLTSQQLQELNLGAGPVHPNCRGRVVAVV